MKVTVFHKPVDIPADPGKIVPDDTITHTLPLSEISHTCEVFDKKEYNCVKLY
ncbi:hypothetical protein [Mucilaginibacter sp.]|uniref:hypothetical protein n=1 Tax=Mucilaginibacter sp. TaxID=1882438 RepID=UPI002636627F|nr:hypothetical protein [Mucilaginibacter sp.]MDB4921528.1 hypothetical protein [Mucilaginibacter sp.]